MDSINPPWLGPSYLKCHRTLCIMSMKDEQSSITFVYLDYTGPKQLIDFVEQVFNKEGIHYYSNLPAQAGSGGRLEIGSSSASWSSVIFQRLSSRYFFVSFCAWLLLRTKDLEGTNGLLMWYHYIGSSVNCLYNCCPEIDSWRCWVLCTLEPIQKAAQYPDGATFVQYWWDG